MIGWLSADSNALLEIIKRGTEKRIQSCNTGLKQIFFCFFFSRYNCGFCLVFDFVTNHVFSNFFLWLLLVKTEHKYKNNALEVAVFVRIFSSANVN